MNPVTTDSLSPQIDDSLSTVPESAATWDRRRWLAFLGSTGIGTTLFHRSLAAQAAENGKITKEMIQQASWIADLKIEEKDEEGLLRLIQASTEGQKEVRKIPIDPDVPPAQVFLPYFHIPIKLPSDLGDTIVAKPWPNLKPNSSNREAPQDDDDLAFLSVAEQGKLLREGKITSVRLTEIYLNRISRLDSILQAVVTRLDDEAMRAAENADRELAAGKDRGPLHGIPWGAKDLIAIPPWKTTWGAQPYREQIRPAKATVAERLEAAGAVLIAKLSLGALAWGEVWFGGVTRNPWNPTEGSSGSSAGSAAGVAAALCSFAIGSETLGSIISPSRRCLVTGLRPSFGRVSRAGCMTLAWSMDKIGPIARYADDCGLILAAICGPDGKDPSVANRSFQWPPALPANELRIGYVEGQLSEGEKQALDALKSLGAQTKAVELPSRFPLNAMLATLSVEAATSFDDLLRSGNIDGLGPWPPVFREGQFTPAVHYLRISRLRTELVQEMEKALGEVDVLMGGDDLLHTNLSGHPSMIVTGGTRETPRGGRPWPIKLTAPYWREDRLLLAAALIQQQMPPNPSRPAISELTAN